MIDASKKRKIYGLRYRMKKKGYRFEGRNRYCYMPDDPANRSKLMERRLVSLGYGIGYNMLHLFAENGGGKGLLACNAMYVSLLILSNNLIQPT